MSQEIAKISKRRITVDVTFPTLYVGDFMKELGERLIPLRLHKFEGQRKASGDGEEILQIQQVVVTLEEEGEENFYDFFAAFCKERGIPFSDPRQK